MDRRAYAAFGLLAHDTPLLPSMSNSVGVKPLIAAYYMDIGTRHCIISPLALQLGLALALALFIFSSSSQLLFRILSTQITSR